MKYKINTKLRLIYQQNVSLEEENKILTKEIENLKNNIHEMIPGINSNTSNSFPMLTELQIKINDYIKLLCQDIFFDVLQPNLNLEGVIFFFKTIFIKISEITFNYFSPIENIIKQTLFICKRESKRRLYRIQKFFYNKRKIFFFMVCYEI